MIFRGLADMLQRRRHAMPWIPLVTTLCLMQILVIAITISSRFFAFKKVFPTVRIIIEIVGYIETSSKVGGRDSNRHGIKDAVRNDRGATSDATLQYINI